MDNRRELVQITSCKGECLYASPSFAIIFWGFRLYKYDFESGTKRRLKEAKFPRSQVPFLLRLFSKARLTTRLFRLYPRGMEVKDERYVVFSLLNRIYIFDLTTNLIRFVEKCRAGFSNVLHFCSAADENSLFLFGDYGKNSERLPVNLYRITKEFKVENLFVFDGTLKIRHVHNVVYDRYRNGYIVLTGDSDLESKILFFDPLFQHMRVLLDGSQNARSVICLPVEAGLVFATDAVEEPNYLYLFDFSSNSLKTIAPLPGSVIYGKEYGNNLFFSTTVEPTTKTGNRFAYYLTRHLGAGIKDNLFRLFCFAPEPKQLSLLLYHKKDCYPLRLLGYGFYSFPALGAGSALEWVPLTVHGSRACDFRLLLFRPE